MPPSLHPRHLKDAALELLHPLPRPVDDPSLPPVWPEPEPEPTEPPPNLRGRDFTRDEFYRVARVCALHAGRRTPPGDWLGNLRDNPVFLILLARSLRKPRARVDCSDVASLWELLHNSPMETRRWVEGLVGFELTSTAAAVPGWRVPFPRWRLTKVLTWIVVLVLLSPFLVPWILTIGLMAISVTAGGVSAIAATPWSAFLWAIAPANAVHLIPMVAIAVLSLRAVRRAWVARRPAARLAEALDRVYWHVNWKLSPLRAPREAMTGVVVSVSFALVLATGLLLAWFVLLGSIGSLLKNLTIFPEWARATWSIYLPILILGGSAVVIDEMRSPNVSDAFSKAVIAASDLRRAQRRRDGME